MNFVSDKMVKLDGIIKRSSMTSAPIFLVGETGTGKSYIAEKIHELSSRKDKPLVKINCASIPRELLESELFGHVKGSFTGAYTNKTGLFQTAGDGTIFLDEITEMPIEMQSKLLRVVQDKKVRPVGSSVESDINCRFISASNLDPLEAVDAGKLRSDLYYRLNIIKIEMPPLRERKEDIPIFIDYFASKYKSQENRPNLSFSNEAISLLISKKWNGNIRELDAEIYRSILFSEDDVITDKYFIKDLADHENDATLNPMEEFEKNMYLTALIECNYNQTLVAKKLKVSRPTVQLKMSKYKISRK